MTRPAARAAAGCRLLLVGLAAWPPGVLSELGGQCDAAGGQCADGAQPDGGLCEETHASCAWASAANCSLEVFRVYCPRSCGTCARHRTARACKLADDDSLVAQLDIRRDEAPPGASEIYEGVLLKAQEAWRTAGHVAGALSASPLVLQFDGFISPDEAAELIGVAEAEDRWRASPAGDLLNFDVRNSSTLFCSAKRGDCVFHPTVIRVTERLAGLLGVPSSNFEHPQFVRYRPTEHYAAHHDVLIEEMEKPYGPRIFTFLLYLNQVRGGGTHFPQLQLRAETSVGRGLLWANAHPFQMKSKRRILQDSKTEHAGEPPVEGIKYAMNIWIHNGPWKLLSVYDC
mmetsp:Transcript_109960/g.355076  ORF Transcript_109960/g.355076 Transcript_109960/m.355076 type:complete len:343 (-) Transcript_109960:225-1253(-)